MSESSSAFARPSHSCDTMVLRSRPVNLGSTLMGGIALRRLCRHPRRSSPPSWECAPSGDSSGPSRVKQAQRPRQGSAAAFAAPPGIVPGQAGCAANRSIVRYALGAARHCGSAASRRIRECGRGTQMIWRLIRFRADRPTGSPPVACGCGQAPPTPSVSFRYVQQISQRHLRVGVRRHASLRIAVLLGSMRLPSDPSCYFVTIA